MTDVTNNGGGQTGRSPTGRTQTSRASTGGTGGGTRTTGARGGGTGGEASGGTGQTGGAQAIDQGREALTNLQAAATSAASELGTRATAAREAAREWATHQTDVARQTVVEKPFASAGAAFAAGLVFGLLLSRR